VKRALLPLVLFACSSTPTESRVFVLNGLDIPVVVAIDSEAGDTRIELAPRGRANPAVGGKATVKVTTKDGNLISESEAQLGKRGAKGCYYVYNVVGAAAYVHEDVVYGTGFGTATVRRRAGEITEQECYVTFAFREPSDKIAVDKHGPAGENRGWLHYEGDGGWVVAVNTLLDDTGQWASQSRGKAQRIVRAVVTHDPQNPALPAIAQRLAQLQLAMPEPSPGNLLAQPERRRRASAKRSL
jgi:hypothetical protein